MILRIISTRRFKLIVGATALILLFGVELVVSANRMSQTFDEAVHLLAGYRYWKDFDFGINPEHPPLVKLVAAMPLLWSKLRTPAPMSGYYKSVEFTEGRKFLYANNANALLLRARLGAALFTLCLALTVFLAAKSMWGTGPAIISLVLLVFDPNIIAHGALVTTDIGVTLGLFGTVFAFYEFVKRPSTLRLVFVGLAAGVALATKHSGVVVFPILLFLGLLELQLRGDPIGSKKRRRSVIFMTIALAAVVIIAIAVLWSTYGFRFSTRPAGMTMNPPLKDFAVTESTLISRAVVDLAKWKVIPEAYPYGILDLGALQTPTYLFGRYYSQAQWFYFPAIFTIKSTLGFLSLLLLAFFAPSLRNRAHRRELLFLIVPAIIYWAVAMGSGINLGVRHILPIYPFLIVITAAGAWNLARTNRTLGIVIPVLVLFHVTSSIRTFPNELAYANELWGGTANSYRIMADSDMDWGQGLNATKKFIDQHAIKQCWFAYFGAGAADAAYYGIPCHPLPNSFGWITYASFPPVPLTVSGPVFFSASEVAGTLWGGDAYNPYVAFRGRQPSAVIADSILYYRGPVDLAKAAAVSDEAASRKLLGTGQLDQAMSQARAAVAIAPNTVGAHVALAQVLARMGRFADSRKEYQTAHSIEAAYNK